MIMDVTTPYLRLYECHSGSASRFRANYASLPGSCLVAFA